MPFTFEKLDIPEVILITPELFEDDRGYFMEWYKKSEFVENGIAEVFVQGNQSLSKKGVLRGLHYQLSPFAQGKLIRCIKGEIFDVAVDIRRGSTTFGHWVYANLSCKNMQMMYIPPGFAHGFLTLSDEAEILYKTTSEYSPDHDRSILWNDSVIDIKWPLTDYSFLLADKDKQAPTLKCADVFE